MNFCGFLFSAFLIPSGKDNSKNNNEGNILIKKVPWEKV